MDRALREAREELQRRKTALRKESLSGLLQPDVPRLQPDVLRLQPDVPWLQPEVPRLQPYISRRAPRACC